MLTFPARLTLFICGGVLVLTLASQLGGMRLCAEEPMAREFAPAAIEFFEEQVRPVLVQRCFECHSGESKKLQGGLRLDSRDAALKGGDTGPALIPGKPKESLLVDAINYGDVFEMPPKSKLPAEEIAVLTKWVEMGAPWPKELPSKTAGGSKNFDLQARQTSHWCWQPVRPQSPPAVKNDAWPRQPLDHFVLAKLDARGLAPASPADKRTLIRRAYFDLIGLPPARADVAAFLADDSPKAFEKVVDRLLDSPHFGERWARHWMDLVRYSETYGHEFDFPIPHAAQYRDYLIRAFNADVPYDQFVREHLAGDLLPNPRRHPTEGFDESVIGTGFWFLGEATHAPVDARGDEGGRVDNQIDVMTKTFLGVTVACARCHDHKFDAISTQDYYALSGVMKSSRRQEALLDPHGTIANTAQQLQLAKTAGDEVLRMTLAAPTAETARTIGKYLLAAREALVRDGAEVNVVALAHGVEPARLGRWVGALQDPALKQPTQPLEPWLVLAGRKDEPSATDIDGQRKRLEDATRRAAHVAEKSVLFADFKQGNYDGWFVTGQAFGTRPTGPREWDAPSRTARAVLPGVAHSGLLSNKLQGVLRSPTFTISHKHIHHRMAGQGVQIRLIIDGYFMDVSSALLFGNAALTIDKQEPFGWRTQAGDIGRYLGHRAHLEFIDHGDGFVAVDEIRFSDEGPPPDMNPVALRAFSRQGRVQKEEGAAPASLAELAASYGEVLADVATRWQNGPIDRNETELVNWLLQHDLLADDAAGARRKQQLADAGKRMDELGGSLAAPRHVLAICDGTGQNDLVHIRGNHRTLGEEAPRRLLEALRIQLPPGEGRSAGAADTTLAGSGRLEIARQIVDPANPLTSRVMVNRVWHHLFGRGIVATVDNFGVLGQEPTHPELLDYLAREFQGSGFGVQGSGQAATDSPSNPQSAIGNPQSTAWSVKRLIRALMLSSTYQMSSVPSPRGDELDPENLLLHRMRIKRLEGEVIRDAVLKISGRLNPQPFGASVAVHLTPFMQGRGRPGGSGPLDGDGRRSIYTEVRRNFLSPMMLAFDTPIPFNSVGARNVSNVPAQALILMNDPFVVQQAEVWAKRLLDEKHATVEQRLRALYEDAFARPPTAAETAAALEFLTQQSQELGLAADQSATNPQAWSDLCHVLLNVKEFVFVN